MEMAQDSSAALRMQIAVAATGGRERGTAILSSALAGFSGEYWVLRGPMSGPPESALVRTGSPITYNFTDVDQGSLWMLARRQTRYFILTLRIPCPFGTSTRFESSSIWKSHEDIAVRM